MSLEPTIKISDFQVHQHYDFITLYSKNRKVQYEKNQ